MAIALQEPCEDLGVREAAELERARRRIVYAADSRYAVVDAAVIVAAARGRNPV